MNAIRSFILWLRAAVANVTERAAALWPLHGPAIYQAVRVEEFPEIFGKAKVYLAGEGENLWAAAMVCPCGCGDVIELNLLKQARPCWNIQLHPDKTLSLAPSVWRQKGCRSHFWLRRGTIDWC